MVHACKTNTERGGVGWVTVFPSIFFSQPDCRSGRLILRLVSTHSRRKRSPRGVCSRFRAAASSYTYLSRRAFPSRPFRHSSLLLVSSSNIKIILLSLSQQQQHKQASSTPELGGSSDNAKRIENCTSA